MRFTLILLLHFVVVLAALVPTVAIAQADQDDARQQLEQLEQKINETLKAIDQKTSDETGLLEDLDALNRNLQRNQERVKKASSSLKRLQREINARKKELAEQQNEVAELQEAVQERLVALYKSGESGVLKTLFSSRSLLSLLEDYDFLSRIVNHDHELLDEYRKRLQRRQETIARLARSKDAQAAGLAKLRREDKQLQQARSLKKKFLTAIRRDRSALDTVVADLRKRAARLTSLVNELESDQGGTYSGSIPISKQKGVLPWPVKGPVKVGFGKEKHPELGTLIESHGIEIETEVESPIKAVWPGRVAFAKRFQGYGNLVIVNHQGGYYTLYAQAAKLMVKAGDSVKAGDTVALSGYEGSDVVYFEIRKGRTPLDPLQWIVRR